MACGIGDRHRTTLREAQQWELLEAKRVNQRFEVLYPRFEGDVIALPVGESTASFVVSNQLVIGCQRFEPVPPHGTSPLKLEVTQPIGGFDQRRAGPDGCKRDADAVSGSEKTNLLLRLSGLPAVPSWNRNELQSYR